jgi:hypothetical protein
MGSRVGSDVLENTKSIAMLGLETVIFQLVAQSLY